nr:MAG: replication initiator protein [Microvirus sp.]
MTCHAPLQGYRSASSKGITFNLKEGYRDFPMSVPCGQCLGCRIDKSRQWALRCVHEASLHELSCFVTLTYDDQHLPPGGTLVKRDLQLFIKKLRRFHEYHNTLPDGTKPAPIRFYACGEYGEGLERPHYHVLFFGLQFGDARKHSLSKSGLEQLVSDRLDAIWGRGHCYIGKVSFQSAAYCARYVIKKVTGDRASAHYEGRIPEFSTMSTKPGIGSGWFDKYKSDAFPSDFLVHQGKRIPVPKFYTDKLSDKELKPIKRRRKQYALDKAHDNTPQRLAVRAEVLEAKYKRLKREL